MATSNKVIYFDCFSGVSGDMIIGSLLDLGVDLEYLKMELQKLPLTGYLLEAKRVMKSSISAVKFNVILDTMDNHCHRHLKDIIDLIESSALSDGVKQKSIAIFNKLAEAEAKIHNTVPEKIHFHEVGAVDAIIDIVGSIIGLEFLQASKIVVSPMPLGKGFVTCQHGTIPVPAPATVELLKGMPVYGSEHNGETVTPTGAAILSTLAGETGFLPKMKIIKSGYGAGTADFDTPNLLRAIIGTEERENACITTGADLENLIMLESNIDDMIPEFFENVFEKLFENGALDVFITPVQMKKNRPGSLINVLCKEKNLNSLVTVLFMETTTLGIRLQEVKRLTLQREIKTVKTKYGEIRVKQARIGTQVVNQSPEYGDCKLKAEQFKVPLKDVYYAALRACDQI